MKLQVPVITGLFLFVIFTAPSTAQEHDLLGVFFDEEAGQTTTTTTEPFQPVPFYLILLDPSHSEGINAWECILETRTEGQIYLVDWQMRGEAFNIDQPPAFLVYLATPLPQAESVVLMSATAVVVDPETEVLFYLHPYDPPSLTNPPGYPVTTPLYGFGDDNLQSLGWASGCEAEPVARINDDGMDPDWGLDDLPAEIVFDPVQAGETAWEHLDRYNDGEVVISGQIDISGLGFTYKHSGGAWTDDQQWFRIEPQEGLRVNLRVVSAMDEEYTGSLDISVCGTITTITLIKPGWPGPPDCWHYENGDAYIVGGVGMSGASGDVVVVGHHAYVANRLDGLFVVDVSVPYSPVVVGAVDTPGAAHDLAVTGHHAYVADWGGGLQVIDIADPASPTIVGVVDEPTAAWDVDIAGHHAFVACAESGLLVVDISESGSHSVVAVLGMPGPAYDVTVADNYAYVADHEIGMLVVDVSEPSSPVIMGAVETPYQVYDVAVAGNHAYVVDRFNGLYVIDISEPASPTIVGAVEAQNYFYAVAVAGDYAYVGHNYNGLQVIDISDPGSPAHIGYLDTPGRVYGVATAGNYVYVADFYHGLQIALQQCEGVVSIEGEPEVLAPENDVPVTDQYFTVHPNPFNPQTTVTFSLEQAGLAKISIYDLTGRLVTLLANQPFTLGTHTLTWSGHDSQGRAMPSGTYIVRLETETGVEARKVMLVR